MQVGLVGVGRMGGGLRGRWQAAGHEVVSYDQDAARSDAPSLRELVARLRAPRVLWVMVPAGHPTEATIVELMELVEPGDVIIDGGNSNYRDSIRRSVALEARGVHMLDAGTSGGVWGETNGYCVMVGGTKEAVAFAEPLFAALVEEGGWAHLGGAGAGHFVKMAHNGIEYGLMQAYAEGFALMRAYDEPLDLQRIAGLWQHGSVVRSWLLELAERALESDPDLSQLRAVVDDSGEGRWMVEEAVARAVPLDVITLALFNRFTSRDDNSYAMRMLAALRREFGGHAVHTG
jgi:6-phosphogluconate dehydrogenase